MRLQPKGKRRNKFLYLAIIILVVLSMAQPLFEFKGSVFVHEDTGFIGLNSSIKSYLTNIYNGFFIYDFNGYSGVISQYLGSPISDLISLLFLPTIFFGGVVSNTIYLIVLFIMGSISMFAFIYYLFDTEDYTIRVISSFLGSLIFFVADGLIESTAQVFLPLSFISMLYLIKTVNSTNLNRNGQLLSYGVCSLSFALLFSVGGSGNLIQNFILLFLTIVFVSVIIKQNKLKVFYILLASILLALLANASMIAGAYLLSINNVASSGYYSFITSVSEPFAPSNVLLVLIDITKGNVTLNITKLIIFLISIFGLFYIINKRRQNNALLIFSIFTTFMVITFFSNTVFKPFGNVFYFFVKVFPFLYAARGGEGFFVYVIRFITAVMFSTGIVFIYNYFKTRNISRIFFCFVVVISFIAISYIIFYSNIFPYLGHNYYYVTIPNHVYTLSDYLNTQNGNFSIAVLPAAAGFQYLENWYTGPDIYSYLINKPVYTGGYIAQTEIFYPITKYFYDDITYSVDNSNSINNNYISHIFGILGIKYILVQGDAIRSSQYDPDYYDVFSFNDIYANLNKSNDIVFIKKYANTSLYENLNYVPLVYATNIHNFGNTPDSKLTQIIANKTFNITDNSVYVTNINNFYNNSDKSNVTTIKNFSRPTISFIRNTPAKVTVHVSNATRPYYLVFRETYSPHWVAFYQNGTELDPNNHISVNGFANAWYVTKAGNYTLTLYYNLQSYAFITWVISIIAFILILVILLVALIILLH